MRKGVCIFLALAVLFLICSCGAGGSASNREKPIYDSDGIKVYVEGIYRDEQFECLHLRYRIENRSNVDIESVLLQFEPVYIDDVSVSCSHMSEEEGEVAQGKTGFSDNVIHYSDIEKSGLDPYHFRKLQGTLKGVDSKYRDLFEIQVEYKMSDFGEETTADTAASTPQSSTQTDTKPEPNTQFEERLVYDSNGVRITLVNCAPEDGINLSIRFKIENNSDTDIECVLMQFEPVYIDNVSVPCSHLSSEEGEVGAGRVGFSENIIYFDDMEKCGLNPNDFGVIQAELIGVDKDYKNLFVIPIELTFSDFYENS